MKSIIISIIFSLLILPAFTTCTFATEEQEYNVDNLPVKGMVTMIDLGKKNVHTMQNDGPNFGEA